MTKAKKNPKKPDKAKEEPLSSVDSKPNKVRVLDTTFVNFTNKHFDFRLEGAAVSSRFTGCLVFY